MPQRTIEVFTTSCPCCDDAVRFLISAACPGCDVQIRDVRNDSTAQARAKGYGIDRVPAVVIDGSLADCCSVGTIDITLLRSLFLGKP